MYDWVYTTKYAKGRIENRFMLYSIFSLNLRRKYI